MLSQLAVDRGDGYVQMSLPEFYSLPLVERIQLILRKQMRFYDEFSHPIALAEGLKLLRESQPAG
jgi:hypothetical protein